MALYYFILLFICGIIIVGYKLYKRNKARKEFENELYERGYMKVKAVLNDGDFITGFITEAQYRAMYRGLPGLQKLNFKHFKKGEVIVMTKDIFYLEVKEVKNSKPYRRGGG